MNGFVQRALAAIGLALGIACGTPAAASDMELGGAVAYALHGTTVELRAERIGHTGSGGGLSPITPPVRKPYKAPVRTASSADDASGNLRLELWALEHPYAGGPLAGHRLTQTPLQPVLRSAPLDNVAVPGLAFTPPPDGTWYLAMALEEDDGDGYAVVSVHPFASPVTFVDGNADVSPQPGLWWNPDESGSGYAIDFRHGTVVVLVFSYTAEGASQWYIATGALDGNVFTGTLARTAGGQCVHCAYQSPVLAGDDGPVSIVFTSNTSGVMYFGGERVIQVVPEAF